MVGGMLTPGEGFPVVPETAGAIESNIAATEQLLDVLRAEAAHPRSVLPHLIPFNDDGSWNAGSGPFLPTFTALEQWENMYQAGLRADGAGQVVLIPAAEGGGAGGRVVLTLRSGTATRLIGERTAKTGLYNIRPRERLDGRLAPPELLIMLGVKLVQSFEATRAVTYGESPTQPSVAKWLGSLLRALRPGNGKEGANSSQRRQLR